MHHESQSVAAPGTGTNSPACNVSSPADVTGKPGPHQAVGAGRLHPFLNAGPGYLFHGVEITAADIEVERHIVESGELQAEAEARPVQRTAYDRQEAAMWAAERQRGIAQRRPEIEAALAKEYQLRLAQGPCSLAEGGDPA